MRAGEPTGTAATMPGCVRAYSVECACVPAVCVVGVWDFIYVTSLPSRIAARMRVCVCVCVISRVSYLIPSHIPASWRLVRVRVQWAAPGWDTDWRKHLSSVFHDVSFLFCFLERKNGRKERRGIVFARENRARLPLRLRLVCHVMWLPWLLCVIIVCAWEERVIWSSCYVLLWTRQIDKKCSLC